MDEAEMKQYILVQMALYLPKPFAAKTVNSMKTEGSMAESILNTFVKIAMDVQERSSWSDRVDPKDGDDN